MTNFLQAIRMPHILKKMDFLKSTDTYRTMRDGPLQEAVDAANAWMATNNITPLNVETIFEAAGGHTVRTYERGVRIWYREEVARPA